MPPYARQDCHKLKQPVNTGDDLLGGEIGAEDQVRFLQFEAFAGGIEHSGAGDIQHHRLILLDRTLIQGFLQSGHGGRGCREYVVPFFIEELKHPIDDVIVCHFEEVTVGFLQCVKQTACETVRRLSVGKDLR